MWTQECTLLLQFMVAENLYEAADVGVLRQEVMGRLDTLVKLWVRKVTEQLNMGEHLLAEANAKIYTFGSYRLGVHLPGAGKLEVIYLSFVICLVTHYPAVQVSTLCCSLLLARDALHPQRNIYKCNPML